MLHWAGFSILKHKCQTLTRKKDFLCQFSFHNSRATRNPSAKKCETQSASFGFRIRSWEEQGRPTLGLRQMEEKQLMRLPAFICLVSTHW